MDWRHLNGGDVDEGPGGEGGADPGGGGGLRPAVQRGEPAEGDAKRRHAAEDEDEEQRPEPARADRHEPEAASEKTPQMCHRSQEIAIVQPERGGVPTA